MFVFNECLSFTFFVLFVLQEIGLSDGYSVKVQQTWALDGRLCFFFLFSCIWAFKINYEYSINVYVSLFSIFCNWRHPLHIFHYLFNKGYFGLFIKFHCWFYFYFYFILMHALVINVGNNFLRRAILHEEGVTGTVSFSMLYVACHVRQNDKY